MKRALDIVVAAVGLLLVGPVLALAALAVRIKLGRPVLFRQVRAGLHGHPFAILKLRTMLPPTSAGQTLSDADRLTPLGRWLRATSIDELPSLVNVLRGEMSLVGPRPLHVVYVGRYTPAQARRLDVRPGVTGWAQVNGRNALDWEAKFALDCWYVEHRSLWLDLRILAMTVGLVLRRRGISGEGEATMSEFRGASDRLG